MGRTKIDYPKDWVEVYSKYRTRDMTGKYSNGYFGA